MQAMYSKIKIVAYSEQEAVDMTNICTKHKINESDFMRKAIVGYIEKVNTTPEEDSRYMFV